MCVFFAVPTYPLFQVKTKLSANFGSETAMRNFARNLQQKLQYLGSMVKKVSIKR